jgi:hypothetical protein
MAERKRAGYTRRIRQLRDGHGLPALSNRQRSVLLDLLMQVTGDAVTDPDLRVLIRLAGRGLCG